MAAPDEPTRLPDELEDRVLAILDGDDAERDDALRALLAAEPHHAATIRAWLEGAGVPVPRTDGGEAATGDGLPGTIGGYRLLELLGRGGFGSVHKAQQETPIRRTVALKLLNPGMGSREILARFAGEREALNRMDHPGIARLLDAGIAPDGRPFFVMELVEGPTLAHYCRRHGLPLRARIELFLLVLDAVQHAHQKAVVHRDLSANNVLVADRGGAPQPKIIDFGIAKSLRDPFLLGGALTMHGTLLGTPEYMSPEQAAGRADAIDIRADVYSLGVQLYELLTEQLPIPSVVLRAQGVAGMARIVAEHVPPRASEAAPAERRRALRGDLDAILRKALAKERDERYATVAEFAADLRAHLADRPVQVATPTRMHRLRKFVRRNKAASAAAAIATAALVAATIVLAVSLQVARDALDQVADQQRQLAGKADAGFRLLANDERLRLAIAAAEALPPPWPENAAAYAAWEREHAWPLALELDKTRESLRSVEARRRTVEPAFADPADQHLFTALLRLRDGLEAFFTDGAASRVAVQRRRQTALAGQALAHAEAWRTTIAAVKVSDGRSASRAYGGIRLEVQPGLAPLGVDPATGLAEFLDLLSHPEGAPLPARGPDGRLAAAGDGGIVFVLLPPGSLRLGATRGEPGLVQNDPLAAADELGGESVRLDPFFVARTELTVGQWARLQGRNAGGPDLQLPLAGVAWSQARAALLRVGLDLPTEAQWEYACRAGTTTPWSWGTDPGEVLAHANGGTTPLPAGSLRANAFGLFDLHGNVAEWCRDAMLPYGAATLRTGDGLRSSPDEADDAPRITRGGSFGQPPAAMRSSARAARPPDTRGPDLGVRPVRAVR